MKAGKIWGDTESLLVTPMIEVHRINVLPHMHCSMHKHNMKWNMFYVIKGELEIHQKKTDYELIDVTKINNEGKVIFGSTVFLEDLDHGDKISYKIVGKDEADLKKKLIYFLALIIV